VIDVDGVHRTVHVNHLRKFHSSIADANVNNCAIIFEADRDFGDLSTNDVGQSYDSDDDVLNVGERWRW
jgi:hypothetical protein